MAQLCVLATVVDKNLMEKKILTLIKAIFLHTGMKKKCLFPWKQIKCQYPFTCFYVFSRMGKSASTFNVLTISYLLHVTGAYNFWCDKAKVTHQFWFWYKTKQTNTFPTVFPSSDLTNQFSQSFILQMTLKMINIALLKKMNAHIQLQTHFAVLLNLYCTDVVKKLLLQLPTEHFWS